jgi:hypothetical protein
MWLSLRTGGSILPERWLIAHWTGGSAAMEYPEVLLGFMMLVGLVFFMLQANILNWIGMKGWPLLILIWLFGMSAVNLPPQFLNDFTKYGVYSWSPYRFSSDAFRDILYYDSGADFSKLAAIFGVAGVVLLILLLAYMFTKGGKVIDTHPPTPHQSQKNP